MIILYFCFYVRIIPEENTALSQSSLLVPVCSLAGKGHVGKYTAGVLPITWAVQQFQLEKSKSSKWSKYNAFKAKQNYIWTMWDLKSFCSHDIFLLLCSYGLSKVLFAISNEKGCILFHKSLRKLTKHIEDAKELRSFSTNMLAPSMQ